MFIIGFIFKYKMDKLNEERKVENLYHFTIGFLTGIGLMIFGALVRLSFFWVYGI